LSIERIVLAALMLLAAGAMRADFTFALLGDAPYWPDEETQFIDMLREINQQDVAFVVHVGDIKNGSSPCDDAVFLQRREMFAISRHPLIYLPGDNEWTDCWRLFAGSYDPLERLAKLREVFFNAPTSLGMTRIPLTRQSDTSSHPYPEHVRWIRERVLFAGFNLPGGDNNLNRMPDEHAKRDRAAREWLNAAFALARSRELGAVVLLMQANPFTESLRPRRGFTAFLERVAAETANFAGPVLLVNGDTHHHRIDHPVQDPVRKAPLRNLTRVEVFGSPRVDWVRVRAVDTGGRVTFAFSPGR